MVFGTVDTGVPKTTRQVGLSFLDVLWDQTPFRNHRRRSGDSDPGSAVS